jgi:hypothetical protein
MLDPILLDLKTFDQPDGAQFRTHPREPSTEEARFSSQFAALTAAGTASFTLRPTTAVTVITRRRTVICKIRTAHVKRKLFQNHGHKKRGEISPLLFTS